MASLAPEHNAGSSMGSPTPAYNGVPSLSLGSNVSSRPGDENQEAGDNVIAAKRPRGRPPGSKNKPKPPQIVTVSTENGLASYVFEIAPGADVVACLVNFAKVKGVVLTVLHATGSVNAVNGVISFRHSGPISGCFDIVSFHGTYPVGSLRDPSFTMWMAPSTRLPGNLVGGIVTGPIIAAGPIIVTAGIFSASTFYKLPLEDTKNENLEPGLIQSSESGSGSYYLGFGNTSTISGWTERPQITQNLWINQLHHDQEQLPQQNGCCRR